MFIGFYVNYHDGIPLITVIHLITIMYLFFLLLLYSLKIHM